MTIWIIIGAPFAGIIFLIDYLLRRKKWKDNTTGEKASLIVNMVSVVPHMILSAFGLFLGLTGNGNKAFLADLVYNITLYMAGSYFLVALGAVIGALILRKMGKIKASIWINVITIAYIVVVSLVNYLADVL